MIEYKYIKDFEKLGFGTFVHFGAYSQYANGEWAKFHNGLSDEFYEEIVRNFKPKKTWAEELVATAKASGCKYITLTTRHHDGYSLYDACGVTDYDAPHYIDGRDLVREFVDACRAQGVIPFFYHTLLDWHNQDYKNDFKSYLKYLRASVEILCKNYGKIGGIWFDGKWDKPDEDWEEDELYSLIRKYQPEAMIINNTGVDACGQLGNIELDSVTFERGKPGPINNELTKKYVASEMCEVLNGVWGYSKNDFSYKSVADMIKELCDCRKYGSNFLLNVGPTEDGTLRPIDKATFETVGEWVKRNDEAIRAPRPYIANVVNHPNDFVLQDGKKYYLFCYDIGIFGTFGVVLSEKDQECSRFEFDKEIESVKWLDNGQDVPYEKNGKELVVKFGRYPYGVDLVVRVAVITTK